jgi:hypothetical protein
MASRGFCWINLYFEVGVAKFDAAALVDGFPTSFPVLSRGKPALNMASFGVATLGAGFQCHPEGHLQ